MRTDDRSFEFFLLYLEQLFSHSIFCFDEGLEEAQTLLKDDPIHVLDLYLNYLYQHESNGK